jgi:hypothetical protein
LICDITKNFPYWFCKKYRTYAEKNFSETFDQHFILAAIAPRYVMVGSCDLDAWADPISQQLCALAASEAWEHAGFTGLSGSDHYLQPGEALLDGHVGYFLIHCRKDRTNGRHPLKNGRALKFCRFLLHFTEAPFIY